MNIKIYGNTSLFVITVFTLCAVVLSCDTTSSDSRHTYLQAISATDGSVEAAARTRAIAETAGEGMLVAGVIQTTEQGEDLYVTRLGKNGEKVWEESFGGPDDDRAYDMIRTSAGDFVIAGVKAKKTYLLRLDGQGKIIWEHTYQRIEEPGHLAEDEGFTVAETSDGGFVIAGRSSVPWPQGGGSYIGPSILRVDAEGKRLWFKQYFDGAGKGHALAITQTQGGDFLVPGLYESVWPFRVTSDGTLVQPLTQGGNQNMVYTDIASFEDGTYMMTGRGFDNGLIMITKMSSTEEEIWSQTYGHGNVQSLTKTKEGDAIVAGTLQKQGTSKREIYLFKINSKGEVLWRTTRELAGDAELFDVKLTGNGAIIATGVFHFPGWRIPLFPLILRADTQGNISTIDTMLQKK